MKDLDWSNLSFGYRQTDYNVRCYYRDGKWGEIEVCSDADGMIRLRFKLMSFNNDGIIFFKKFSKLSRIKMQDRKSVV